MPEARQEGDRLWPLSVLPIGYQFLPSDEDLVSYSLRRKIDGHPLPPFILESDVFGTEPWNFPGDVKEERYFFCRIKNEAMSGDSSSVCQRVVGASGYWKLTGTEKQIITLPLNAFKSRFRFCEGGGGEDQEEEEDDDDEGEDEGGGSTNAAQTPPKWIMHEFRPQYQAKPITAVHFARVPVSPTRDTYIEGWPVQRTRSRQDYSPSFRIEEAGILLSMTQENQTERDQWAAYRVFQKKPKIPQGSVIYLRSSLQDHLNRRSTRPYSRSSS